MGNSNSTATGGINKLIKNTPLIMKYLNKSVLYKNYMNTRCLKVKIPGDEIDQKSSFYIYNIEGFFDIEKGIYFSLIQILEAMKFLEENNIQIKDYKDLEQKVNTLLCALQLMNTIGNFSSQNIVPEQETEKKCVCKEVITEKKNENININFGDSFNVSYNKNEEKIFKQMIKLEQKENLKKEINGLDLHSIANYTSLILILIQILGPYIKNYFPVIRKAINWLNDLIPFDELKDLVSFSIRAISGVLSGATNIIKGIATFPQNKVLSILNLATGFAELGKVGVDAIVTYKTIEKQRNNKRKTKAQENFLSIINQMENKISELIDSNLEGLKKNNIIILGIDESKYNSNEGTDLQLFKIDNIDGFVNVSVILKTIDLNIIKI